MTAAAMQRRWQVPLAPGADLPGFRRAVRGLVAANVPPEAVDWTTAEAPGLFWDGLAADAPPISLSRAAADLIDTVVCHRDAERYGLLYAFIWRVRRGEKALLEIASDPLVHRLQRMQKSIRRDLHKMHAFLRFRRVEDAGGAERFRAWFEPDHFILEAAAPFFVDRFASLVWSILTPIGSAHWDGETLTFGPPGCRDMVPAADAFEDGWRGYYESTFNPARSNPRLMQAHMPKKYWRNMPEAAAISAMIQTAPQRVAEMLAREVAMPNKRNPDKAVAQLKEQKPKTLAELNRIIAASEPLVPGATRAVLGEGRVGAPLAFVGEQPGDQEDREGHPFVGPAGQLLDRALAEVGIDRSDTYVTNAVKHFKFERRGKKRIHQKPTIGEIKHYRWWLMKELELVRPRLVVALGGTAATALIGKSVAVTRLRGAADFTPFQGYITVHPSYLLRLPDAEAKAREYEAFVDDLRRIRQLAA